MHIWKYMVLMFHKAWLPVVVAGVLMSSGEGAVAADKALNIAQDDATDMQALPARVTLGFERLRLPDDEHVGLLGASYVVELAPGWWFGPALYGAATGRRGGLFTWGAEGQRRWRLGDRWEAVAGVYVGGGGGAGAPVGGGLMLRPHVDLMLDFGGWATGISASQVRFPSGAIHSTQFGLLVTVPDTFAFTAPGRAGQSVEFTGAGGLGADRMQVTAGHYASGSTGGRSLGYAGMRLERQLGHEVSATLEAAGAATGGADGYAEVLGGALALWPIGSEAIRVGLRAAIGLGGGGAVLTGGGPIAKTALLGRVQMGRQLSIELETGRARAFRGDFSTAYAQLSVGMALGEAPAEAGAAAAARVVHDMEWSVSVQDYLHAQRKDGSTRSLSTLGLKFRRSLSEHLYLSGEAHSAVAGSAGAYSAGLVGLGTTIRMTAFEPWSVGAEAMVGAAGGGGVASRGGAIAQPMVWIARDLGRYSRLKVGAGYVKSLRGGLSSPVIDMTWAFAFGTP
ncbi:MAG: hypothetical protein QFC55_07370 [Chloroflexota bacterium]|nr:hypothetical protein [Chloroflexota bacterium]